MNTTEMTASKKFKQVICAPHVHRFPLYDDGTFPNNGLPLVLFREAVILPPYDPASLFEGLFESNQWTGSWRNGIYTYHHYHSTAHEVLGLFKGSAKVQFGGPNGIIEILRAGDVVAIPAGVAHKKLEATGDLGVVGAYPSGQHWDMCYGKPEERPRVDEQIGRVPLPKRDPIYGPDGPLLDLWRA